MAATVGVELDHQFAQLRAVVDQLADDPAWQRSDDQVLHRVDELGRLINRLTGIRLQEIHEAHRRKVCEEAQGWTLANHLMTAEPQPLRAARATVKTADEFARFDKIRAALSAGTISPAQARAIIKALSQLPATVTDEQLDQAQAVMLEHAARFD